MKSALLVICIILSAGAALFFYFRGMDHQRSNLVITDTLYVPYAVHDTLKVRVYRIKADNKPGGEEKRMGNGISDTGTGRCSIASAGTAYNFIARADTVYNDSLLSLRLGFLSPIPIHPDSRFIIDISYRKMQVTRLAEAPGVIKQPGKLHFSVSLGLGIGLLHKQADIFAGAGISYSF